MTSAPISVDVAAGASAGLSGVLGPVSTAPGALAPAQGSALDGIVGIQPAAGDGFAPLNVVPSEFPPEPLPGNPVPFRGTLLNLLV